MAIVVDGDMQDPRSKPPAVDKALQKVLDAASAIPHNDYIVGRGTRKANGGVQITAYHVSPGLGDKFVAQYAAVEQYDSAAQQFLCAPFLPITIKVGVSQYVDDDSKDSHEMNSYLQGFYIKSLLLVGLESSRGLCWMTLYRLRELDHPFTAEEAELASYRIRAALFEWQMETGTPVSQSPDPDRYRLLPLGRRALDVAMRRIRGLSNKVISRQLQIESATVAEHLQTLKKRDLSIEVLLDRMLGPVPPARPGSPTKKNQPRPKASTTTPKKGHT